MTNPTVEIEGENLPEPFDGIDSREYSTGNEAVYYPTRFEIKGDIGVLYLDYSVSSENTEQRMWVNLDLVNSIKMYHN